MKSSSPRPNPLLPEPDRAVLAGLFLKSEGDPGSRPLEELAMLAETAGVKVSGIAIQKSARPHPKTCVGAGKADELARLVKEEDATLVIFNNDLSGAQARNLEKILGARVIDRTELILDIFFQHARTNAAKTQVELAKLEYSLPRLRRMWTHLDRIRGGIGLRGAGEKQIEFDRRMVGRRIAELKKKLDDINKRRERLVSSRRNVYHVSLVGYTNAGKSTLMNALTEAEVLECDQLFATLDTKTCAWELGAKKKVLLSDTVGFIKDLPHHLVASFHATLEEVRQADLLLHVADASSPEIDKNIAAVEKVLDELGCADKRTILCLNKTDRLRDRIDFEYFRGEYPDSVGMSAKTGAGLEALAEMVRGSVEAGLGEVTFSVDPADGRTMSLIASRGEVVESRMVEDRMHVTARLDEEEKGRLMKSPGLEVVE